MFPLYYMHLVRYMKQVKLCREGKLSLFLHEIKMVLYSQYSVMFSGWSPSINHLKTDNYCENVHIAIWCITWKHFINIFYKFWSECFRIYRKYWWNVPSALHNIVMYITGLTLPPHTGVLPVANGLKWCWTRVINK